MKRGARNARAYALSAALCLSGIALAWWIYPHFVSPLAPRDYGDNHYASELRDREGRKIFPGRRPLQYILDPFTSYRLAPEQHLPWLNTDLAGNRVTPGSGGPRPVSVLLGGSTAMGYGTGADGETIAAQLQKLRPRESWINEAVAGYGSGNELARMVHYADDLRPAIYLALDGWNDFDIDPTRTQMNPYGFNDYWMQLLEDRLWHYYLSTVPPADQEGPLALTPGRKVSRWKMQAPVLAAYEANVLKMRDFARARGARFFLAVQPGPKDGGAWGQSYLSFAGKITEFCREKAVDCIDLNGLEQVRSGAPGFYSEGVHLTPAGYAAVARTLSEWLDRQFPR